MCRGRSEGKVTPQGVSHAKQGTVLSLKRLERIQQHLLIQWHQLGEDLVKVFVAHDNQWPELGRELAHLVIRAKALTLHPLDILGEVLADLDADGSYRADLEQQIDAERIGHRQCVFFDEGHVAKEGGEVRGAQFADVVDEQASAVSDGLERFWLDDLGFQVGAGRKCHPQYDQYFLVAVGVERDCVCAEGVVFVFGAQSVFALLGDELHPVDEGGHFEGFAVSVGCAAQVLAGLLSYLFFGVRWRQQK